MVAYNIPDTIVRNKKNLVGHKITIAIL